MADTDIDKFWDANGQPSDRMQDLMEPPPPPSATRWFKSRVTWGSLGYAGAWKIAASRLRVTLDDADKLYYVTPYDLFAFKRSHKELRVGPYATLEDAQLAAEMLGEIRGTGYTLSETSN